MRREIQRTISHQGRGQDLDLGSRDLYVILFVQKCLERKFLTFSR